MVTINYKDSRPFYEQVKAELRQLIVSGVLPPGEKLSSVRELAGQLAINPNTIQRAYRELESEGYIVSVPGRGSFVAERDAQVDPRRSELLRQPRQTARELMWMGMSAEELRAQIGGEADEHD